MHFFKHKKKEGGMRWNTRLETRNRNENHLELNAISTSEHCDDNEHNRRKGYTPVFWSCLNIKYPFPFLRILHFSNLDFEFP